MPFDLNSLEFPIVGFDSVIDARSPSEFAEDHIPGAINLPVLSDAERARVGTIYVQDSAFKARKIGAALVARNAAAHIDGPLAHHEGGWRPLVYCWRGGQRSGSFASILSQIGWRAETLNGGYQSFRRKVVACLHDTAFPAPVILLDGNTGTAKTEVLARLGARGIQTIDLEGLANHRGSALGGLGAQPSQKAFETALAVKVAALDPARPVVIEAESSKVGTLNVPARVFEAMKSARRFRIAAPVEARAAYLTKAYADVIANPAVLAERLDVLTRLQGREKVARWQALARDGAFTDLATELITDHYDPGYRKARARQAKSPEREFETPGLGDTDLEALADRLANAITSREEETPLAAETAR